MNDPSDVIVLASRSPRRFDLLSLIVPSSRIVVQPPRSPDEPGFAGLDTFEAIVGQIVAISELKRSAVARECDQRRQAIVAADTVVIGEEQGTLIVLGQPPAPPEGAAVVRDWFHRYYLGKSHRVVTAVSASDSAGRVISRTSMSRVTISADRKDWLDWYLSTGESWGKAGGYAIQGLGSVFVECVEGSLSNIAGLPLVETALILKELGCLTIQDVQA